MVFTVELYRYEVASTDTLTSQRTESITKHNTQTIIPHQMQLIKKRQRHRQHSNRSRRTEALAVYSGTQMHLYTLEICQEVMN